jgi:hypothetical protein
MDEEGDVFDGHGLLEGLDELFGQAFCPGFNGLRGRLAGGGQLGGEGGGEVHGEVCAVEQEDQRAIELVLFEEDEGIGGGHEIAPFVIGVLYRKRRDYLRKIYNQKIHHKDTKDTKKKERRFFTTKYTKNTKWTKEGLLPRNTRNARKKDYYHQIHEIREIQERRFVTTKYTKNTKEGLLPPDTRNTRNTRKKILCQGGKGEYWGP